MSSNKPGRARRALVAAACALFALDATLASQGPAAGEPAATSMFAIYAENRREGIPNLITADFLINAYAMVLQNRLEQAEDESQAEVREFTRRLAAALDTLTTNEPGLAEARAFAATLVALGNGTAAGASAAPNVVREIELVAKAEGVAPSAVTGLPIDYSQMKPRGRYTRSEDAQRYFRVVRYAGAVLFPLRASAAAQISPEQRDRLTGAAVTMSRVVHGDRRLSKLYQTLDGRTRWMFGQPDDLTVADYVKAMPGEARTWPIATVREHLEKQFAGRRPQIIGAPVDVAALEPGQDARDVLLGWRLFPSRVTPDRAALQQLVYGGTKHPLTLTGQTDRRSTTTVQGRGRVRGFPLSIDLLALLGSADARRTLDAAGEHEYTGFEEAFGEARQSLTQGEGLPLDHLEIIRTLTEGTGADTDVRLNSAAALWTLDKHRELLYAKQSYTGVGKSVALDRRTTAWLDPELDTYLLLRRQLQRATMQVGDRAGELKQLSAILDTCIEIARDERRGVRPTGERAVFLNNLDASLRDLTTRDDRPIATDIHTDLNSGMTQVQALAAPTVVEAPVGAESLARGALFTHVEFRHPVSDRLTDESWAQRVQSGVAEATAASARLQKSFAQRMAIYVHAK
jgi:hypothetical protein